MFRDDKIVLDSVTSTVADWHIDRCTPSRDHRSARWSYISMYPCCRFMVRAPRRADSCSSWAGPGTTWNSHAAPNTGTVRRLANLFPFVREFTEVILLRPRQAQRSIALGNRESRCTVACSAPSGGSLLQRVSSPSQERHRQAQVRVHGCEVNPSWSRSWSLSTKLLVGRDFKRDCLSPRNSRKFFGRELKVAGLPSFDLWLKSFDRPRAQFLTYFPCSDISDAPFSGPVACWRSTRPKPLTAPSRHPQLSLRPPLCRATRSRHPSRSLVVMMFCAPFVALTISLSFHSFISSVAHSRPFVLCSSAATRRVGRVQVDGDGLRHFSG